VDKYNIIYESPCFRQHNHYNKRVNITGDYKMSKAENDSLYELASEHMQYWAGTQWEDRFQNALDRDDLDELALLLKQSAQIMWQNEYNPNEVDV
jgi:hypothetical protein